MMQTQIPLTDEARQALERAANEARRRGYASVTPEHLLLALIHDANGGAARLLGAFGVDAPRLRQAVEATLDEGGPFAPPEVTYSAQVRRVLERASREARALLSGLRAVHLLLGILSDGSSHSARLLGEAGVSLESARAWLSLSVPRQRVSATVSAPMPEPYAPPTGPVPLSVSPVFLGLLAVTALAAGLTFAGIAARIMLFVFVVGGWVVSLSLHEFGHALVAYVGGDRSVRDKGYLTLNPFRYTHVFLSIIMPLIFLAMGGIGLPGGAVYINLAAIPRKSMRSLVSAAGPLASSACAGLLLLPFALGLDRWLLPGHREFWAGLALIAFLELTAVFFNLLPIPGLDGFGIIAPYLPERVLRVVARARGLMFILFFLLFMTPLGSAFFGTIALMAGFIGLDTRLVIEGLQLFRFWGS